MSSKWLVIIFAVLWIVGLILFFLTPFLFIGTLDIGAAFTVFIISSALIGVGFLGFFISLLYWIFAGRKKVGA